ncbi:helix-turn-helix domain-containing protein [Flammeovirga agarivorans]|uniref:AraC family transcriptional regulator n=1 Tax=Flammeovirga agarivorans TaxID=2726742 RepID=A0A7X8SQ99_9BACT|nr:helix-turn-helix domain-containing protein [Flammeovirga agarivorans]NLR94360.1 AraC family transcriptional regulator [Flammeovirga agarivorans]
MRKFLFETFALSSTDVFHLASTSINNHDDLNPHDHDYFEFFIVSDGEGIHKINNKELSIQKGEACFIRPHDVHTFKKTSKEELVITNLAIKADLLPFYKERYFTSPQLFYWNDEQIPLHVVFTDDELQSILGYLDQMVSKENNLLTLDTFVLHLFSLLKDYSIQDGHLPSWLNYSLKEFKSPQHLKTGINGFIELSQRSGDHVNRVVKKCMQKTLTELVNDERLLYTANQLAMTNAPIKSIYTNAGFENHSYFFRIFKKKYGITPQQYRSKNHKVI